MKNHEKIFFPFKQNFIEEYIRVYNRNKPKNFQLIGSPEVLLNYFLLLQYYFVILLCYHFRKKIILNDLEWFYQAEILYR